MKSSSSFTPVRLIPAETEIEVESVRVGKDVLELISGAMYVNPLDIYREYVQNAADALDRAGRPDGDIEIEILLEERAVLIRDEGIGIPNRYFSRRMTSIGASEKRGTDARGFRGVGRLSGLSYCKELLFRSKAADDKYVCEVRWDGKAFREMLRDPSYDQDLMQVVRDLARIRRVESAEQSRSFFEVELRGVARLQNDVLLNADLIRGYLSQVAPVPFDDDFCFAEQIHSKLSQHGIHKGFQITLIESGFGNRKEELVLRPHCSTFALSPFKKSQFSELHFIEIPGIDGNVDAVAWIADHDYYGAIPKDQLIRGIRFRNGNIQIGPSDLAADWFAEPRFNSWIVGEVHVLTDRIVPNGRRDAFESNAHLSNLRTHLTPALKAVAQLCRRESAKRQFLRRFEGLEAEVEQDLKLMMSGSIAKRQMDRLGKDVDLKVLDLEERAAKTTYGLQAVLAPRAQSLRSKLDAVRNRERDADDPLGVVPYGKRLAFQEVLELIYINSTNKPVANGIVDKIVKQLAERYGAS